MLWSLHCLWPFMQPHLVGGGYWSVSASKNGSSGSQLSSFSSAADMADRPRATAGASTAFGCEELDNPNAHRSLGNSLWAVMVTEPGATSLKHRKLSPDPVDRGILPIPAELCLRARRSSSRMLVELSSSLPACGIERRRHEKAMGEGGVPQGPPVLTRTPSDRPLGLDRAASETPLRQSG